MASPNRSQSPTNADDWEAEEGVPSIEDPFIQKYLQGRNALIEEEKKRRHGMLFLPLPFKPTHNGYCVLNSFRYPLPKLPVPGGEGGLSDRPAYSCQRVERSMDKGCQK